MKKTIRVCTLLLAFCLLASVLSFAQAVENDSGYVRVTNDTVETAKNVTKNEDGTYTITLEAWATGQRTTTTVTQAKPMDIILVIDRSGSMKDDSKGSNLQQTLTGENGFLDTVATNSPNSRVAIVSYSISASIDSGTKDASGALVPISDKMTDLKDAINGLTWNGSTNAHLGLQKAANIFQSISIDDPNYSNERLVIFLTDGIPGGGTWGIPGIMNANSFDSAQKSIHISHIIKNAKGEQTSIDFEQYFCHSDSKCSEKDLGVSLTGCGATIYSVGIDLPDDDDKINEYMYRVSSHRPDGSHVGCNIGWHGWHGSDKVELKTYNDWEKDIECWYSNYPNDHTRNMPSADASNNYYMEGDPSALSGFFGTISSSITTGGASNTTLTGESTYIQDVITPYFSIPSNANSVSWHTETFTGNDTWTNDNNTSTTGITVDGNTVQVSGFNFSENWVGMDNGVARGKKLVVSIVIRPTENFLGGDGVPTNVDDQAGLYHDCTIVENFPNEKATATVSVCTITPDVQDQTIYLSNSTDLSKLLTSIDSRIDGVNNAYADVTYTLKQGEQSIGTYTVQKGTTTGTWAGNMTAAPTDCTEYTIACTVTGGTNNTSTGTGKATIHVLKPTITAADKTIYLSQEIGEADVTITGWSCTDGKTAANAVGTVPAISGITIQQDKTTRETSYVPDTCADYTAVWNLGGTDFSADYTVHVLKPTISTSDVTIYRGNITNLNDRVGVNGDWVCTHNKTLSKDNAPALNYSFQDSATISTPDAYSPEDCAAITATATVGSSTTTLPVPGFTVHVLQPTLTLSVQDVWADYDATFDLAEKCITESANSLTWADKNSDHSVSVSNAEGTAPTVKSKTFTFDPNTGITGGKYTVGEADATFSVEAKFTLSNSNNTSFAAKFTDNKDKDTFTVHVNKFNLTVSHDGTQNAIFTLNDGTKLAVPAGKSVTVHGLICGKSYSIREDSDNAWTWRYDAAATGSFTTPTHKVSTTDPGTGTASVEMKYGNQTNTLWLNGQAYAINRATTGLVDALPAKTKEEEG